VLLGFGIGSRAHDLGEQFLIRVHWESAVIGLNDVRVEPRKNASWLNGDG